MEIVRKNFRFKEVIDITSIIDKLHVFYMEQVDIDKDDNIRGEMLEENETLLVLMDIDEQTQNKYCYIKIKEEIGLDNETRSITVKKIIVDNNCIEKELFKHIFTILLQQNDDILTNRIIVPKKINNRFHNNIQSVADEISAHVIFLYSTYTNPVICPSYEII